MPVMTRKKHYKLRSKVYHGIGTTVLFSTTIGGFFGYQALTNFQEFTQQFETETLMVIDPETVKMNPIFAVPITIGIIVFLFVIMKRDKEFFKGKASLGIVIAIAILYAIYSIAIMTIATLAGALTGTVFNEVLFDPLSKRSLVLAKEQHETDLEFNKEKRRIEARKAAQASSREVNDFGNV
jgi:hypothetical protein